MRRGQTHGGELYIELTVKGKEGKAPKGLGVSWGACLSLDTVCESSSLSTPKRQHRIPEAHPKKRWEKGEWVSNS